MAKAPRISIADQLATIAATSPRDHVKTSPRGDAAQVSEATVSAIAEAESVKVERQPAEPAPRHNAAASSRDRVTPRKRGNVTEDGLKIRQRIEKPHVSLYAHPRVLKKLREIAVAEDCKPHDLYVQGLRLVLKSYGYDLDKLESGEA